MSGPNLSTTVAVAGRGHAALTQVAAARALGVALVAIGTRDIQAATTVARAVGTRAVSYAELSTIADMVIVATPPIRHLHDTGPVLEAGRLAVVLPPLACSLADADRLIEAGTSRLAYGEHLLLAPVVLQAFELARNLGQVTNLEMRLASPPPDWWRSAPARGGGVLLSLGSRAVALALAVNGPDVVRAVDCSVRSEAGVDVEARARLTTMSGLEVLIHVGWGDTELWDLQVAGKSAVVRAELLPLPSLEHNGVQVAVATPPEPFPLLTTLGHIDHLRSVLDDRGSSRAPSIPGEFGRLVLAVVLACYCSAGNGGGTVTVSEIPASASAMSLWRI